MNKSIKFVILCFLLGLSYSIQAQNIPQNSNKTDSKGLRQGKWTILYDADWNVINDASKAEFYRLITYTDDKPTGKVYDMYADGRVQMETSLLADRPQDVMQGETTFYNTEGNKEKTQIFEQGVLVDEFVYNSDGIIVVENWQILDSLGTIYNKEKNYSMAFEVWERSRLKAIKEFGIKHANHVTSLKNLASLFKNISNYPKAEYYYSEALQIQKETLSTNDIEYAKTSQALASIYMSMGNYSKGEEVLKEVINIYKTDLDKNQILYGQSLRVLGLSYYYRGDYPKTEECFLEAKIIAEKSEGKESINYGDVVSNLGELYKTMGEYAKAEPYMKEALVIFKKNNDSFYSSALGNLAILTKLKGDVAQSQVLFLEVLEIQKEVLGTNNPSYANTLNNLAIGYYEIDNYTKAEPMFLEVLQTRGKILGEKHPSYLQTLVNLARLYENTGRLDKAESLYIRVLDTRKIVLGDRHTDYVSALNDLGFFYFRYKDNPSKAEPMLTEAVRIYGIIFGKEHLNYANYLSNLGVFYFETGSIEKAEDILLTSLGILQKKLGANHPDCARVMNTLGNLYAFIGNEQAKFMFNSAVTINLNTFGEKSDQYAYSISNLGGYYEEIKEFAKADSLYKKALSIQEEILGKDSRNYLLTQFHLATVNKKLGYSDKAESLYLENSQLWKKNYGTKIPQYTHSILYLGIMHHQNGKYEKAVPFLKESSSLFIDQTKRNFTSFSEKERKLFVELLKDRFEFYTDFTYSALQEEINTVGWLYDNTINTKGILLNTQNKIRNIVLTSEDTTLQNQYQSWRIKRNTLAQVYQMTNDEKKAKGFNQAQLEEEINQLEKQISRKSSLFAESNDNPSYTWKNIQQKLKENEAALEIIRFRTFGKDSEFSDTTHYAVLIITSESKNNPDMIVLENGNDLEGKYLRNYNNSVKAQKTDTYSYEQYWQKIAEQLKKRNIKKVYVSPDGVYNQINLYTLQNSQTGKYLDEEIEIQLLGNTKDLITQEAETKLAIQNGVFIGYPDFENSPSSKEVAQIDVSENFIAMALDSTQRFFDGSNIAELPGTKVEIENIQSIFTKNRIQSEVYLAKNATETTVKNLKSPQILHIATHGFFLQVSKDNTGLEEKRNVMGVENEQLLRNPLLRSGLLFAGASQALKGEAEEGILTAYEAMSLNLDNTELVVMSACETGLGEISNGEGVYGLQRAFQVAGAKTVLMSLWTVSDEATKDLMTLFYENWITKKQTKHQAFINARKELRKKYPAPYYWGAFVMVGE